ncbi:MAG: ABC transporter permease subunit, partial [Clostridia bacterium]|nr:ABC transporter permease subunit [Clostridia bacterium]
SSNSGSRAGYNIVNTVLAATNKTAFTVNSANEPFDLASAKDIASSLTSMLVPMLMFALLASACIAVAPESIAGEKERGTMATMLITPVKRVELALGKIISLSCFALLSGISSFLGVILSLPKLTSGLMNADTAALYTAGDYFMTFGIIISVVLIIISAFSVLSAYAKSVKEAGTLITPLMMVIILLGMVSMFFQSAPPVAMYLIPLLGSGLAMSAVMSFSAPVLGVVLSIISNLVVAAGLTVLLAFMFKSERIMFKK